MRAVIDVFLWPAILLAFVLYLLFIWILVAISDCFCGGKKPVETKKEDESGGKVAEEKEKAE